MDKELAKTMLMERMGWNEAELIERGEWVVSNCICGDCPSYTAKEMELGFCWVAIGESEAIFNRNDCICGQCPVFNQAELRTAYYCTRGSELEQLGELSEPAI